MKKKQIFALVDCNNFYASCERVFQPQLQNKPIGVLSNNDGIIVALSQELKDLGITRGTPGFKIKHMLKKYDIHLFSSNYTLYGDMSKRVMSILARFTPDLEIYSIDEAFLCLTGLTHYNLNNYGANIRKIIYQWTGLPVSVGLGCTKTLAKVANRLAKRIPSANGVYNLIDHPQIDKILESLKVNNIWGIGPRYAKMLNRNGIYNARQLVLSPDKWIQRKMTIVGLRTVLELRGCSCIDLEKDIDPKKEIVSSKSFGIPVTSLSDLQEAAASYCIRAVEKLREENQVGSQIMIYLSTNRFKDEQQYANFEVARLPLPSAYTPDFLGLTRQLVKNIFRPGYNYKKVGIMITDIIHQSKAPLDLFTPTYLDDNRKVIMDCMDTINQKMGINTLTYASRGIEQKWQMKRNFLTSHYTTRWQDIPLVKA